jgi:hypothetical protein
VSTLRSALDDLASEDLSFLTDEELGSDFAELHRACQVMEAERLRRLADIARRGPFARDGYLSTASWLSERFHLPWSLAAHQVRMARALASMPLTREALGEGEIPLSALRPLVLAREDHPEAFAQAEESLVEAARSLPSRQFHYAVAYWSQAVDAEASAERSERLRDRRRLHVSPTAFGMVRIEGTWTPRPGRACWWPCGPRWTPRPGTGMTGAPPPSAGPTVWGRSAGGGSITRSGPRWVGSDPTSR